VLCSPIRVTQLTITALIIWGLLPVRSPKCVERVGEPVDRMDSGKDGARSLAPG
jgi:hypothetical protein